MTTLSQLIGESEKEMEKVVFQYFNGKRGSRHGEDKLSILLHQGGLTAEFLAMSARAITLFR